MQIDKLELFRLPDGSAVGMYANDGDANGIKSADFYHVSPDGCETVLCSVDFNIVNGLRSHLYTSEDICATRKFPGFGGKK